MHVSLLFNKVLMLSSFHLQHQYVQQVLHNTLKTRDPTSAILSEIL